MNERRQAVEKLRDAMFASYSHDAASEYVIAAESYAFEIQERRRRIMVALGAIIGVISVMLLGYRLFGDPSDSVVLVIAVLLIVPVAAYVAISWSATSTVTRAIRRALAEAKVADQAHQLGIRRRSADAPWIESIP